MNRNRYNKTNAKRKVVAVVRHTTEDKTPSLINDSDEDGWKAARKVNQHIVGDLDKKNKFRKIWFSLHACAACFALGLYDQQTLERHVSICDSQLSSTCSRCHGHFQDEKKKILDSDQDNIEKNVFDIHVVATSQSDEMYIPPQFEQVKELYRSRVRRLMLTVINGHE